MICQDQMKMLIEEEEENYDDNSKTKSLKNIRSSKNQSSNKNNNNQIMVQKEYGYVNCEEKNQQILNLIFNKFHKKLSHIVNFDLLVDIDSRGSVEDQQEEQFRGFDLLHYMKPVYEVQRKKNHVGFHIPENNIPIVDINYSLAILENQQLDVQKEFAQLLRLMQIKMEQIQQMVKSILERNNYNMEFMISMKKKRQQYVENYCQTNFFSTKAGGDRFMNIAGYSVCILNKALHLSYLVKSRGLIHLLGTDEDQITRIAMKKSQMDIFSFESRNIVQRNYINYVLYGKSKNREQNFNIITYDNISIYCPADFELQQIIYPPELQYDPEIPCNDFILISYFDIQPFHINKVLGIRKQADEFQKYIQNFDQDFEYNIQSEQFLQKFYQKSLKKIHKKEIMNDQKEREIKKHTCGFRLINNQNMQ